MIQQVDAPQLPSQVLYIQGGEDKKYAFPLKNLTAVELDTKNHHLRLFSHIFEGRMLELKFANDIPRIAHSIHKQITGDSWAVLEDSADKLSGKNLYVNAFRVSLVALTGDGVFRITSDEGCLAFNASRFSAEDRTKFFDKIKDTILQGKETLTFDQPTYRVALHLQSIDHVYVDHTSKSIKIRTSIESEEVLACNGEGSLSAFIDRLNASIQPAFWQFIPHEESSNQKIGYFFNARNVKSIILRDEGQLHLQFAKHKFTIGIQHEAKDKAITLYQNFVSKANKHSPVLAFTHVADRISVSKKDVEFVHADCERRVLTLYSKFFSSGCIRCNDIADIVPMLASISRQLNDHLWTVLDDASENPMRRFFVNLEQLRFVMFKDDPKIMFRCENLWYSLDTRSFPYERLLLLYDKLKEAMRAYLQRSQTPLFPNSLVNVDQLVKKFFLPESEIEAIHIRPRARRIDLISKLFPEKFLKLVFGNAQDFNVALESVTGRFSVSTMRVLEDRQTGLGRKRMFVNLSHLNAFRIDSDNAISFLSRVGPLKFESSTFGSDVLTKFFKTLRKSYTTYALSELMQCFLNNQAHQAQNADAAPL